MRRILLFGLVSLLLMLTGCNIDDQTQSVDDNGVTKIEVALPQTRTSLGEKAGDAYPVYWSAGDKIVANGVISEEVSIDATNQSSATFVVKSVLDYPLNVTYPYAVGTTAATPYVEFKSEQTYAKGTFAEGSAPMCGYAAESGSKVEMKHLAGLLKFPVKASAEGVVLQKIVVTSSVKISGGFDVDCATATLTPTPHTDYAGDTHNVVTYTLPANYTLSTTSPSEFYISIPAIEVGECKVEFIEASGDKMESTWKPSTAIKNGVVREFKTITYARGGNAVLETVSLPSFDDVVESRIFNIRAMCYNIHNCSGTDGVYDEQRIADVINAAKVEAVSIQEVDSMTTRNTIKRDIMKSLGQKTGMYHTFGAAMDYRGGKYGVGVLTKEKPISYYTVPLPCSDEPRVLLIVELENYYFCCSHFSLKADYRTEAVRIITEEAKKLNKPMILSGDFNAQRSESSIQTLAEHFEIFEKQGPKLTFPAGTPTKEIDYFCLYKDNGAMAVVKEHYVYPEAVASDHRPIVIDMTVCE